MQDEQACSRVEHHCRESDWQWGAIGIIYKENEGWLFVAWTGADTYEFGCLIGYCPFCGKALEDAET